MSKDSTVIDKFLNTAIILLTATIITGPMASQAIVNGIHLDPSAHPWSAYIQMYKKSEDVTPSATCSGTLIKEQYILTAAHCLHGFEKFQITIAENKFTLFENQTAFPSEYATLPTQVVVPVSSGKTTLVIMSPPICQEPKVYDAEEKICVNPNYDIGLMKLSLPLTGSASIAQSVIKKDEQIFIAGYGAMDIYPRELNIGFGKANFNPSKLYELRGGINKVKDLYSNVFIFNGPSMHSREKIIINTEDDLNAMVNKAISSINNNQTLLNLKEEHLPTGSAESLIAPGDSGSAIFNSGGEIVGLTTLNQLRDVKQQVLLQSLYQEYDMVFSASGIALRTDYLPFRIALEQLFSELDQ